MNKSRLPVGRAKPGAVQTTVRLDATDLKILTYMVQDARMSQRALAKAVGMSPPSVADRIARLEERGVITGYAVRLDYSMLQRPITAIIGVKYFNTTSIVERASALVKMPEVERVSIVTGSTDLEVRVLVRDLHHLNEVLLALPKSSDDIRHTDTLVALETFEPDNFGERLIQELSRTLELAAENPDE